MTGVGLRVTRSTAGLFKSLPENAQFPVFRGSKGVKSPFDSCEPLSVVICLPGMTVPGIGLRQTET